MLQAEGFQASGGQIIDVTFVEAPRQRNGRDGNEKIKKGEIPAYWSGKKSRPIRTLTRLGRRRTALLFMTTKTTSMSIARTSSSANTKSPTAAFMIAGNGTMFLTRATTVRRLGPTAPIVRINRKRA
ncbi:MAG TPA: hypothetical protein VHT02_10080 [Methylocella sp.]|jgi:hypothetical protein|nr:hypothetical protein [Methylocella sp.]